MALHLAGGHRDRRLVAEIGEGARVVLLDRLLEPEDVAVLDAASQQTASCGLNQQLESIISSMSGPMASRAARTRLTSSFHVRVGSPPTTILSIL